METTQEKYNAQQARISSAIKGLTADLRAYQEQVKNNTLTDESIAAMDAKIDSLEALDKETPEKASEGDQPENETEA